jgi:hypothetical protein
MSCGNGLVADQWRCFEKDPPILLASGGKNGECYDTPVKSDSKHVKAIHKEQKFQ